MNWQDGFYALGFLFMAILLILPSIQNAFILYRKAD